MEVDNHGICTEDLDWAHSNMTLERTSRASVMWRQAAQWPKDFLNVKGDLAARLASTGITKPAMVYVDDREGMVFIREQLKYFDAKADRDLWSSGAFMGWYRHIHGARAADVMWMKMVGEATDEMMKAFEAISALRRACTFAVPSEELLAAQVAWMLSMVDDAQSKYDKALADHEVLKQARKGKEV